MALGISPKRLDGWEPTETHTYSYDDAGRVQQVTVTRESEWDSGERALVLALEFYRTQCCSAGHYLPTSGAEQAEFAWAAKARKCHMCYAVAVEASRFKDNNHPHTYVFALTEK